MPWLGQVLDLYVSKPLANRPGNRVNCLLNVTTDMKIRQPDCLSGISGVYRRCGGGTENLDMWGMYAGSGPILCCFRAESGEITG
jgi:hypothetical protein